MSKDAYYFSHDSNARQDPKILEMVSVYGMEGYGRYWVLIEMLREQSDHTLKLSGKYTFIALAMQMQCTSDAAEIFVHDCIGEFELFASDGERFWANSLLRRMAMKEEISQKRKKAAEARWGKKGDKPTDLEEKDASGMQMHSKDDTNGMQGKEKKVKESKGKESKGNEKEEESSAGLSPIRFFEEKLSFRLSPVQMMEILNYVEEFEGNNDVVIHAGKIADDKNAKNFNFVKSILNGWLQNKCVTLEDVLKHEEQFKQKKSFKGKPKEVDYMSMAEGE